MKKTGIFKTIVQLIAIPFPSPMKSWLLKLVGARIARNAKLSPMAVLFADKIEIGPHAVIKAFTIIAGTSRLEMGPYSGISNLCIINGSAPLKLGGRSYISAGCMVDLHAEVSLGEWSALGPRTTVMTHNVFWPTAWGYNNKIGSVELGDFVWIGNNCKIGPGVSIDSRNVLVPNSTILTSVKSSAVVYDGLLSRKQFPYALTYRDISKAEQRDYLVTVANAYAEILRSKGYKVEESEGVFIISKGRKSIALFLHELKSTEMKYDQKWIFGYHLDDAVFSSRQGDTHVLDFGRLLHSSRPSRELGRALKYYRHSWGNWFADFDYRGDFKLAMTTREKRDEQ